MFILVLLSLLVLDFFVLLCIWCLQIKFRSEPSGLCRVRCAAADGLPGQHHQLKWPEREDPAMLGWTESGTDRSCRWPVETSTAGRRQGQGRPYWTPFWPIFEYDGYVNVRGLSVESWLDNNAVVHCVFEHFQYICLTPNYCWPGRQNNK